MATRQYVGARYVPKFATPIQWDNTRSYEPLTIVSNLGGSFTSKKPVPAGVDIMNTDYWVQTANYNAQVEQYRQEVEDYKEIVEGVEDTTSRHVDNLADLLASDLPIGSTVKTDGYYNKDDGGYGTFIISENPPDEDDVFYHTLSNGTYAICTDDNYVLPRYGGTTVNEMMDNARNYMRDHQWKNIILPIPNKNHPACFYWIENGKKNYVWGCDAPILFNDKCAYSHVYFYGDISLTSDCVDESVEAVLKISGPSKPEDIYFMTDLRVSGYHYGGDVVKAINAILIEGCARANFVSVQLGFCKNCLTLGGTNQNATIDVHINFAEFGLWSEKCINGAVKSGSNYSCILHIEDLVAQYPIGNDTTLIYGVGSIYNWYIGALQFSGAGSTATGLIPFYFDTPSSAGGVNANETVFRCNYARTGGTTAGTFGKSGVFSFGTLIYSLGADASARKMTINERAKVIADYIGLRNESWEVDTESVDAVFNAQMCYPSPAHGGAAGRNIIVGGICEGTVALQYAPDVIALDTSNKRATFVTGGVNQGYVTLT